MASFFPMLSSSPPPIDEVDNTDKDDDDDFGGFASANHNLDEFDDPVFTKPIDALKKKIVNHQQKNSVIVSQNSKDRDLNSQDIISTDEDVVNDETTLDNSVDNPADCINAKHCDASHCDSSCSKNPIVNNFCNNVESLDKDTIIANHSSQNSVVDEVVETNCVVNQIQEEKEDQSNVESPFISEEDEREIVENHGSNVITDSPSNGLDPSLENQGISSDQNSTPSTLGSESPKQKVELSGVTADIPDLTFIPFEEDGNVSDDFDEFQDYDFSPAKTEKVVENHSVDIEQDADSDNNDEFGNFESVAGAFEDNTENNTPDPNSDNKDDDDFANFESGTFQASGDFANFEKADFEPKLKTPSSMESEKGSAKLATVINAVFPIEQLDEESGDQPALGECNFSLLKQNCKSQRLWERLQETEQRTGMPFQWSVSHSFQLLLRSVNVDYHSILRTSTVPFFASGLGLLEPTKGISVAPERKRSDSYTSNMMQDPIPPVEFDWSSSGLINPLDAGQSMTTLMDLSFFNTSNSSSRRSSLKDYSLENELLSVSSSEGCQKAPIYEQLISSNAKSSLAENFLGSRPPNLSQETILVLDQLPDISYMRAQMLMFPVLNSST